MDEQSSQLNIACEDKRIHQSMETSFVKIQNHMKYRCNSVGQSSLTSPRRQVAQLTSLAKSNTGLPTNQDQAPTSMINLTTANLTTRPDEEDQAAASENLSRASSNNQLDLKNNEETAAFDDEIENDNRDSNDMRQSLQYFISESKSSEQSQEDLVANEAQSNALQIPENALSSHKIGEDMQIQSPQQKAQAKKGEDKPIYMSFQKQKKAKGLSEAKFNCDKKKVINTGCKLNKKK